MELRQEHFTLDRLVSLCHGNTACNSSEQDHLRLCKDCEAFFHAILREQRTRGGANHRTASQAASSSASV